MSDKIDVLSEIRRLADDELLSGLAASVRVERERTADEVAHISEVDARRLYLQEACSSMFVYCVERLHLSEAATFRRITVARTARNYPLIFELLAAGALHLSAVTVLSPHLSPQNHKELLAAASYKSKREVERLVAALAPEPEAIARIRRLPTSVRTSSASRPSTGGPYAEAPLGPTSAREVPRTIIRHAEPGGPGSLPS